MRKAQIVKVEDASLLARIVLHFLAVRVQINGLRRTILFDEPSDAEGTHRLARKALKPH